MRKSLLPLTLLILLVSCERGISADSNTGQLELTTRALFDKVIAVPINEHRLDMWDSLVTDDYLHHCQSLHPLWQDLKGREIAKFYRWLFHAFPDWHEEPVVVVCEGEYVSAVVKASGTMTGNLGIYKPSGRKVDISILMMHRFNNGKLAESWLSWDSQHFKERMGLVPPRPTQAAIGVPELELYLGEEITVDIDSAPPDTAK